MMNPKIETNVGLVSLITGFIIICGITKSMLYYDAFGIKILSYLDFSECILLFLDDFIYSIIFLIAVIIFYYQQVSNSGDDSRFKHIVKLYLVILIVFLTVMTIINGFKGTLNMLAIISVYIGGIALSLITSKRLTAFYRIKFGKEIPKNLVWTGTFLMAVFIIMNLHGYFLSLTKIYFHPYSQKVTLFKDSVDMHTDSLVYLGKTKDYIFFYDLKSNQKTIINTDGITKIVER